LILIKTIDFNQLYSGYLSDLGDISLSAVEEGLF